MREPLRYAELTPAELAGHDLAILPVGALEWHGEHLPLGTDGILAERFAEALASCSGGVVLPAVWLPMTTLPHQTSLDVRTETFRAWVDDTIAGLFRVGFRRLAIVTGHYAQGHEVELYEAAMRAMEDNEGLLVFAATPLEVLGRKELLDHAGRWETAQMLYLRPELVNLAGLPDSLDPRECAVLGDDPRTATAEQGKVLWEQALEAWRKWLETGGNEGLHRYYGRAFDRYQVYVDTYYQGSWEEAIRTWWKVKTGVEEEIE